MKRAFILTALCCALGLAVAAPVTPQQAAAVARTFWIQNLHGKADVQLIDRSAEWNFDGIYLFVNPEGGFVMVAADDAVRPILGYSTLAPFDTQRIPIQLQGWLTTYQQQIDWVRANDGLPYPSDSEAWQRLLAGQGVKDISDSTVAPLLSVLWDQQAPFNELCPPNTVTGCAATAQAMMMKYWNHPAVGYGSHSYTHNRYGQLSADFGHTLYDWAHMPDQPTAVSPNNERLAVATLMYHCGVGLEMGYGTVADGGSAALGLVGSEGYACIDNSLKDYFGYSRDMEVHFRNMPMIEPAYTDEQWRTMLIDELNLRHPIVYTGAATQGGHGFVCDGYDSRQYLHFNFGWSGVGNGYYPVDSISPGHGGVGGNVTYTFNMQNAALFGAVPVYELRVSDTLFNFSGDGGTDSLILCIDPTINASWSVESSAAWLTTSPAEISSAGWIYIHTTAFSGNTERTATITFRQGNDSCKVKVTQVNFSEADMCPLTVIMESTHGSGWQGGAKLTFESAGGYVFGTATLEEGTLDSVQIPVAPHDVYAIFHSGGGTDRYINYRILNQHGEAMVDVEYAYRNGGTHFIEWPCAHVGIDELDPSTCQRINLYPNPVTDVLHIDGLPADCRIELYDITGRQLSIKQLPLNTLQLSTLPSGTYLLRLVSPMQTSTHKLIKQ